MRRAVSKPHPFPLVNFILLPPNGTHGSHLETHGRVDLLVLQASARLPSLGTGKWIEKSVRHWHSWPRHHLSASAYPPTLRTAQKDCVISAILPATESYQTDRQTGEPALKATVVLARSGSWAPLGPHLIPLTRLNLHTFTPPPSLVSPQAEQGSVRGTGRLGLAW